MRGISLGTRAASAAGEVALAFTSSDAVTIAENVQNVVLLTANKPGATFSVIVGGADFEITGGNQLRFKAGRIPDYEVPGNSGGDNIYSDLTVRATLDAETADLPMTVTITDAGDAPTFTDYQGEYTIAENTTVVGTITAVGGTVTYTLGGADAAAFTINSSTGELAFASAPNYESPGDAGSNNVYNLTIYADNAHGQSYVTTIVAVSDAYDTPIVKTLLIINPTYANNSTNQFKLTVNRGAGAGDLETAYIPLSTGSAVYDAATLRTSLESVVTALTGCSDVTVQNPSGYEFAFTFPANGFSQTLAVSVQEGSTTVVVGYSTITQGADFVAGVAEVFYVSGTDGETTFSDGIVSGGATFSSGVCTGYTTPDGYTADGTGGITITFTYGTGGARPDMSLTGGDGNVTVSVQGSDEVSAAYEVQRITATPAPTGGNWNLGVGADIAYNEGTGTIVSRAFGAGHDIAVSADLTSGLIDLTWNTSGAIADNVFAPSSIDLTTTTAYSLSIT